MSQWFRDGSPVTTVAIDDRAFHYGDGLFETVAVRDGKARLWKYHMERLAIGCERLSLTMPCPDDMLRELQETLGQRSPGRADCLAKIVLSSDVGKRGYGRPPGSPGVAYIGLFDYEALPRRACLDGVETVICKTSLAAPSATAGLKTLNRLEQVLGRNECLAANAFEGLMLDGDGQLICGTMSNVFIVSNSSVISPALDRCGVAGVMRRLLLGALAETGLPVRLGEVSMDDVWSCDEIFLTNSQFGLLPVRRCGERKWPVGEVTRHCQALLAKNGIRECAL